MAGEVLDQENTLITTYRTHIRIFNIILKEEKHYGVKFNDNYGKNYKGS